MDAKKCWRCRGRGQVPDPSYTGRDPAYVTCPVCDGSGESDSVKPVPTHTPTPWRTEWGYVGNTRRLFVAADGMDGLLPSFEEDAAFIVRAVNSHDELLAACERVMACVLSMTRDLSFLGPQMEETGVINDIRAAIAKAKGG